jgi:hypothetical protein
MLFLVYLDSSNECARATFNFGAAAFNRQYDIKVISFFIGEGGFFLFDMHFQHNLPPSLHTQPQLIWHVSQKRPTTQNAF